MTDEQARTDHDDAGEGYDAWEREVERVERVLARVRVRFPTFRPPDIALRFARDVALDALSPLPVEPSAEKVERIYVWFADNGHIRKWSREPFEHGEPMDAVAIEPQDGVQEAVQAPAHSRIDDIAAALFDTFNTARLSDHPEQAKEYGRYAHSLLEWLESRGLSIVPAASGPKGGEG